MLRTCGPASKRRTPAITRFTEYMIAHSCNARLPGRREGLLHWLYAPRSVRSRETDRIERNMDFDAELHSVRCRKTVAPASSSLAQRLGQSRAAVAARLRTMLADRTVRVVAAVDPVFLRSARARPRLHPHRRLGRARGRAPARHERDRAGVGRRRGARRGHRGARGLDVGAARPAALIRAIDGVLDISTIIYSTVIKGFFVSEYHGGVTLDTIDEAADRTAAGRRTQELPRAGRGGAPVALGRRDQGAAADRRRGDQDQRGRGARARAPAAVDGGGHDARRRRRGP